MLGLGEGGVGMGGLVMFKVAVVFMLISYGRRPSFSSSRRTLSKYGGRLRLLGRGRSTSVRRLSSLASA